MSIRQLTNPLSGNAKSNLDVRDVSCNTLNYVTLNPPVSGATGFIKDTIDVSTTQYKVPVFTNISKEVQQTNVDIISNNLNLPTACTYKINNVDVLSTSTLGSGVINSSLQNATLTSNVGSLTNVGNLILSSGSVYRINSIDVLSSTSLGSGISTSFLTSNTGALTNTGNLNLTAGSTFRINSIDVLSSTALGSGVVSAFLTSNTGALTNTGNLNLTAGSTYKINSIDVLSSTALGSGVVSAFLTSNTGNLTNTGNINISSGSTYRINNSTVLTTPSTNTFVGLSVGNGQVSDSINNGLGIEALFSLTTGRENNAVGCYSGRALTTGSRNNYIGNFSGGQTTSGSGNTLIGRAAGYSYTSSESGNIIISSGTMDGNEVRGTLGESNRVRIGGSAITDNFFFGNMIIQNSGDVYKIGANTVLSGTALGTGVVSAFLTSNTGNLSNVGNFSISTGSSYQINGANLLRAPSTNTFLGFAVGNGQTSNSQNSGVGYDSLASLSTGFDNACLGYHTARFLSTGSRNTFLGAFAGGAGINTGTDNTFIGRAAGYNYTSSESNNILIGAEVRGTLGESNKVRIGYLTNTDNYFYGNMHVQNSGDTFKINGSEKLSNTQLNAQNLFPATAGKIAVIHQVHQTFIQDPNINAGDSLCDSDPFIVNENCAMLSVGVVMTLSGSNSYIFSARLIENGISVASATGQNMTVGGPSRFSFSLSYTLLSTKYYKIRINSNDGPLILGDSLTVFATMVY